VTPSAVPLTRRVAHPTQFAANRTRSCTHRTRARRRERAAIQWSGDAPSGRPGANAHTLRNRPRGSAWPQRLSRAVASASPGAWGAAGAVTWGSCAAAAARDRLMLKNSSLSNCTCAHG
jgi:hypothetical protein